MTKIDRGYRFYSKLLVSLSVMAVALFLSISIYQAYNRKLKDAEDYTLKKLHSIAKTLSIQIDGDAHQELVCTFKEKDAITADNFNESYQKLYNLLRETQEINDLQTPIYTMFYDEICKKNSSNSGLLFGASSDVPIYRHTYHSPIQSHQENFKIGGVVTEYYDKHGHWLSAFAPIKNSTGMAVAIVQVDESFCEFVKRARQSAIKDGLRALLVLSLVGFGFLYLYRILLLEMDKINNRLDLTVKEKTADLERTNKALNKLNEGLEAEVSQRTQALQITNEELADSNDKLKAFAHIASHDLRAPLRRMNGFAVLLEKKYGALLDAAGKEYINFISSNSDKLSDLISDILNTSLLQHQNSKATEEIDLSAVLNEVLSNLKDDIENLNATIEYYDLPTVKGYHSDFIQLFQNFISNALKYRKPDIPPSIKIRSEVLNDSYQLTVQDNGLGISDDAIQNIFKEFDRGNAKDDEGYGIGLATCKRIIKAYQGTLNVQSTPDLGSAFIFTVKDRES